MHALDWLRDSSQQPIRPVYAVFGSDPYLIRESIDAVSRVVFPEADDEAAVTRFAGAARPRWPTCWMNCSRSPSSAAADW